MSDFYYSDLKYSISTRVVADIQVQKAGLPFFIGTLCCVDNENKKIKGCALSKFDSKILQLAIASAPMCFRLHG